jgi:transposase-like protein
MSVYTLEDRMKAVNLFFKYGGNSAAVRRELGYPSRRALREWVKEHEATGMLHAGYGIRSPKYSEPQQRAAVDYYLVSAEKADH